MSCDAVRKHMSCMARRSTEWTAVRGFEGSARVLLDFWVTGVSWLLLRQFSLISCHVLL